MKTILDEIKNCKHENFDFVSEWDLKWCPNCGATSDHQNIWIYPTLIQELIPELKPPEPPKEPPVPSLNIIQALKGFIRK